jgi:hypothetical protein
MAELTPAEHEKGATIAPSKGYPRGRFPMNDTEHARLALQMLPRAKGLSGGQEAAIRARANRMLAGQKAIGK